MWHNFALTTGIRGISFFNQARSRVEKIFWVVALLASFGETILDVYETVRYFYSGPIATSLKVQRKDEIDLSPIILCQYMPVPTTIVDLGELETLIVGIRYSNLSDFYENETAKILQTGTTTSSFLDLITLSLQLIFKLKQLQADNVAVSIDGNLLKLERFYLDSNFGIDKLLHSLGKAYWCLQNYSAVAFDGLNQTATEDCLNGAITGVGNSVLPNSLQFCMKLPTVNFTSVQDFIAVTAYNQKSPFTPTYSCFLFGYETYFSVESENFVEMDVSTHHFVSVQLQGIYKSKNTAQNRCLAALKPDCYLECKMRLYVEIVGCKPSIAAFATTPLNSQKPFCSLYDFTNGSMTSVNVMRAVDKAKSDCHVECIKPCERRIFSFAKESVTNRVMGNVTGPATKIFFTSFVYPQFEEVEGMSTKQFLAQLGGNLSLWLGASFLVLIHLVLFAFQSLAALAFGNVANFTRVHESEECRQLKKLQSLMAKSSIQAYLEQFVRNTVAKTETVKSSNT